MWQTLKQSITDRLSDRAPTFGEHPMFYPGRDWKIILGTFVALNVAIAVAAVYMFFQVQQGSFFASSADSQGDRELIRIEKTKLSSVIDHYEQRRANFQDYKDNPPSVFDPSR